MSRSSSPRRGPLYPYEWAIVNLILLLMGTPLLFDGRSLDIRPRITGSLALLIAGALLARKTYLTGYLPTRRTTVNLDPEARNIPGWFTVLAVIADLIVAPALWFD